jgi:hypothetical protein
VTPGSRARLGALAAAAALVGLAVGGCSDGPDRSVEALCTRLGAVAGLDEALAQGDLGLIAQQADALDAAVDVAPPDVEPALAQLASAVGQVSATAGTAGGDPRDAVERALDEVLPRDPGGTGSLAASGEAVERWSVANCGLDLSSGTTVVAPPPPSTAEVP